MSPTDPTNRLSDLVDSVNWQLRGLVETDEVRRIKFGLRDLCQRREIARRTEWAREIRGERHEVLDRDLGFRVDPFAGILDLEPMCRLGETLGGGVRAGATATSPQTHNKEFHVNQLLPRDRESLEVMLRIALHEDLLHAATAYLGVVPVLGDMDFFCSLPTPPTTPFSSSQLYHCDAEAPMQVKFFVYCADVAEDDGPLELVDAARSKMVRQRLRYRFGGRSYRVKDEAMDALVPEQHSVVGKRGTSLLLDTGRCFHRGSRIRRDGRLRIVGVIQYVPPSSTTLPLRLRDGAPFAHFLDPQRSPLARAVLGELVA
jgi:hypothetical protein